MKIKIILTIVGAVACISLCYADQGGNANAAIEINNSVNAEASGVTTSMNGNTSTENGVPISSTSATKESRSVTGNGD